MAVVRTRGVQPLCPACEIGDLSLCWNFQAPPIAPGIHSGTSKDASGGYATRMPAHDSMLFPVPDSIPDEIAVFADPFAVSLHAVTRHAPPAGGRVLVYGAGALGSSAVAILRALYPDVEVGVVARFDAQADLARTLGASRVFAHEPLTALIEAVAEWSDGVLHGHHELPMAYPGGVDVVYDTISRKDSLEVACRVLKARGTIVKAGVHGPTKWEWTPLYFKEIRGSGRTHSASKPSTASTGTASRTTSTSSSRVGSISRRCSRTSSRSTNKRAFGVLADQESSRRDEVRAATLTRLTYAAVRGRGR